MIKCARYGCNHQVGSPQQRNCLRCPHNKPVNPPPLPKPAEPKGK